MFKRKPIYFKDFLQKLGEAGITASHHCAEQSRLEMEKLFVKDPETERRVPRTIPIWIGKKEVRVPLLTLMPPSTLTVDAFEVEFDTTVQFKDNEHCVENHHGLRRHGTTLKGKIRFKATENPEALELIREYDNRELEDLLQLEVNDDG